MVRSIREHTDHRTAVGREDGVFDKGAELVPVDHRLTGRIQVVQGQDLLIGIVHQTTPLHKPGIAERPRVKTRHRPALIRHNEITGVEHVQHSPVVLADLIGDQILVPPHFGTMVTTDRLVEIRGAGIIESAHRQVHHPVVQGLVLQDLQIGSRRPERLFHLLFRSKMVLVEIPPVDTPHIQQNEEDQRSVEPRKTYLLVNKAEDQQGRKGDK